MRALRMIAGLFASLSLLTAPVAADARARQLRPGLRLVAYTPPVVVTPSIPREDQVVAAWDSDAIGTKTDGSAMTAWTDTVNGAVANPTSPPTYKANAEGTHPAVHFGGGSQRMEVSNASALTAALDSKVYTILITFKNAVATGGGLGALFSASAGGDSILYIADGSQMGRYNNGLGQFAPWSSSELMTFGTASTLTPIGAASGGYERSYAQGGTLYSTAAPAPATGGNTITIGNLASAAGGGFFGVNADILQIRVWKVTLTPTQVIEYQKYINAKYGKTNPWTAAGKMTVFAGDSITAGVGSTGVAQSYPYKAAQNLSLPYGAWSNLGIGGMKYSDMASLAPTEVDNVAAVTGVNTHLATFEFVNEHNSGAATATIIANAQSYLQGRTAAGITKITFGSSTSFQAEATDRADYNTYWTANALTYAQKFVSLHTDPQIGVNGTYNNSPPFSTDKVHMFEPGNTILAGLFSAQMSTLPN